MERGRREGRGRGLLPLLSVSGAISIVHPTTTHYTVPKTHTYAFSRTHMASVRAFILSHTYSISPFISQVLIKHPLAAEYYIRCREHRHILPFLRQSASLSADHTRRYQHTISTQDPCLCQLHTRWVGCTQPPLSAQLIQTSV